MSFDATTWVEDLGFLQSFSIYSGALGIMTLGLPFVYFYGKKIRGFTSGKLGTRSIVKRVSVESQSSEEREKKVVETLELKGIC